MIKYMFSKCFFRSMALQVQAIKALWSSIFLLLHDIKRRTYHLFLERSSLCSSLNIEETYIFCCWNCLFFREREKDWEMHNFFSFYLTVTLEDTLSPLLLLLRFCCWQPDVLKLLTTASIHCVFLIGLEKYE